MSFLISPELQAGLVASLGGDLRAVSRVSGGDINDAFRVGLSDGRRFFVKANRAAPEGMFEREAEGLSFLRQGLSESDRGDSGQADSRQGETEQDGAEPGDSGWQVDADLVVPNVVAVAPQFLVLELLEPVPTSPAMDERLGRGLARLHRRSPSQFGLLGDNFIGTLPQRNEALPTWAEFFGQRRLLAQADLAGARRHLGRHERRRLERLVANLTELVGPEEPPARLHGDLWGGNYLPSQRGPALIDPAVYGGHREVDLAMMKLFGGFSSRVFAAYEEEFPLAPGWEERVELYQLYPLLVHLNLFGSGYLASVHRVIARYT